MSYHGFCCLRLRTLTKTATFFFFNWWIIYLDKTKMCPYCVFLYRNWDTSNILVFFLFFNRIHFHLVPGTASHFRIHILVTHMQQLHPQEHTWNWDSHSFIIVTIPKYGKKSSGSPCPAFWVSSGLCTSFYIANCVISFRQNFYVYFLYEFWLLYELLECLVLEL